MSHFFKTGNVIKVAPHDSMEVHNNLPVGTYTLKVDQHGNFYLETIDNFEMPTKVYGNTLRHADRIINTFNDRPKSTGVMLAGEKGSGKTLLTKTISAKLAEQNIPTIVINTEFKGENFNSFMQSIDTPCAVLFDEFEKTFDEESQEAMLTLLDGTYPSKKLFILTCNDMWKVDEHMRNRPGRIYYLIEFNGIDEKFISEYAVDNLKDQSQVDGLVKTMKAFTTLNFDMLKAIVEEMNRYGETAVEVCSILNAQPQFSSKKQYTVTVDVPDHKINLYTSECHCNPLSEEIEVEFELKDAPEGTKAYRDVAVTNEHLVSMDTEAGVFKFKKDGVTVTLVEKQVHKFNFNAF